MKRHARFPVFGSETKASASAQPKRQVHLAERISPADLNRLLKDMPGTFDLVDIRPPEAFQDYALPGATNAELAEVLSNPAYLTGAGPLIIVDRDGSLAMMVAGILSQKTKRPIKALHGGLDGFWEETELESAVLLDVRRADFFSGAKSDKARAGHMPVAVNRPFSADVVATDGITRFKALPELEAA